MVFFVKISMSAHKTRIIAALMQPVQTSLVRLIVNVKADFLAMEFPVQVRQYTLLVYSLISVVSLFFITIIHSRY